LNRKKQEDSPTCFFHGYSYCFTWESLVEEEAKSSYTVDEGGIGWKCSDSGNALSFCKNQAPSYAYQSYSFTRILEEDLMNSRSSRIFSSVIVILALLLASCSSGGANNGQATGQVPATGPTATSGAAGGLTTAAATSGAAGQTTGTAVVTSAATGQTTGTASATGQATSGATAQTTGTPSATGQATTAAGGAAQTTPWKGQQIGGTVRVLAVWGGAELDNFNAMIKPFEDQTGIKVQVETTRDLTAVLNTQIQGGNPPDVAGIPNPGSLVQLVGKNAVKPLDDVLDMNAMNQQYDPGLLKLAAVNGKQYGIFTKAAVKSLVWYDPKLFDAKGYKVPKTWDELQALEQQIQKDGATPWCIGIDGGAGSAWPATDWIEDILLHQAGPDTYDKWVTHQIPWTDPAVKQAWQTFGTFINDPKMVFGGPTTAVATNFGTAFTPLFKSPPGCYLFKQADFITSFFTQQDANLKAGTDFNFFVLPSPNSQYQDTLEVAGDLFGMFKDTPQARALIQYMVTPDAQSIWAGKGGYLAPSKLVDPKVYPDDMTRNVYKLYISAKSVRFDGSDQLPPAVGTAFDQGIFQYVGHADQLDSALSTIESAAQGAYSK
jgi:alpha-glucoside transport system substrate-binding protein